MKFRAYDLKKKEFLFDFRVHPEGYIMAVSGESNGKWEYSTKRLNHVILVDENFDKPKYSGFHCPNCRTHIYNASELDIALHNYENHTTPEIKAPGRSKAEAKPVPGSN